MARRIVAIVGSFRPEGLTHQAVEAILASARAHGAETETISLADHPIEFCTNCRACTQKPGEARVRCSKKDGFEEILARAEAADALVIASPVNYWNATALFRRFLERLIGAAYWPWGQNGPKMRSESHPRKAVLVASAGMPGFLIPIATGTPKALKLAALSLGAKPVGSLWVGLGGAVAHPKLSAKGQAKAAKLGALLA